MLVEGNFDAIAVAWPVPARQVQHLALDAAAQPARVALLDALGREMRALDAPGAAVGWPGCRRALTWCA